MKLHLVAVFSLLACALPSLPAAAREHSIEVDGCRVTLKMPGWSSEIDDKRLLVRGPARSGAADVIALLSLTSYPIQGVPLSREVANHTRDLGGHYGFAAPDITPVKRLAGCAQDGRIGSHEARFLFVRNLAPTQPRAELLEAIVAAGPRFVYASLYYKAGMRSEYEPQLVAALRTLEVEVLREGPPTSGWTTGEVDGGIAWVRSVSRAFDEAKRRKVPVFVAIGTDRESVCGVLADKHYRDPGTVALSRKMVCLVACKDNHGVDEEGSCRRYGAVNCAEHRDVEIHCRTKILEKKLVVAPQHLILSPDGHMISRREYYLSKVDLHRMMRGAIQAFDSYGESGELAVDYAKLYRAASRDEERQVVLNRAFHFSSLDSVKDLLDSIAKREGRDGVLRVMRFLDLADHPGKLEILTFYLRSPNEFIRRQAAVLLAKLGDVRATEPLLTAIRRKTENSRVQAKALLALGTSAPGSPKEKSAFSLLKKQSRSGPSDLRISAIIALAHFPEDTERLHETLAGAYSANRRHFLVKSVAALALGRHRVSRFKTVQMMEEDTLKVTDRRTVSDIDWAIRAIRGGVTDPEAEFLDRARMYMLDAE